MGVTFEALTIASSDPSWDAEFWGGVLQRKVVAGSDGVMMPGDRGQLGLRFVAGPDHGEGWNRAHLHVIGGRFDQVGWIDECVARGGRLRGNGHVPPRSFAAMADPVGDEFCVIEDGNNFLAGCGPLGEVTCEGTRAVGQFWSEALQWPLVWDEGEETAIQSPAGGTKVSWSGDAPAQDLRPDRHVFLLVVDASDFEAETARLTALGASVDHADASGGVVLIDPDGVPFAIRTT